VRTLTTLTPTTAIAGVLVSVTLSGADMEATDTVKFVLGGDCSAAGTAATLDTSQANDASTKHVTVTLSSAGAYTACVAASGVGTFAASSDTLTVAGALRGCVVLLVLLVAVVVLLALVAAAVVVVVAGLRGTAHHAAPTVRTPAHSRLHAHTRTLSPSSALTVHSRAFSRSRAFTRIHPHTHSGHAVERHGVAVVGQLLCRRRRDGEHRRHEPHDQRQGVAAERRVVQHAGRRRRAACGRRVSDVAVACGGADAERHGAGRDGCDAGERHVRRVPRAGGRRVEHGRKRDGGVWRDADGERP
jgi:hypothetical protein